MLLCCLGTYFTHVQTGDNVRIQSAMQSCFEIIQMTPKEASQIAMESKKATKPSETWDNMRQMKKNVWPIVSAGLSS